MASRKAYILCRFADRSPLYTSWLDHVQIPHQIIADCPPNWEPPADAAIIITHMHYRWEEVSVSRIFQQNQIPILIICDGILEFRNTWENKLIADAAVFQPVVGHKLACIGADQARVIASWGNTGKCEIVGIPRLDHWTPIDRRPGQFAHSGEFRLLVTTANRPGFTDEQIRLTRQSLLDLRTVTRQRKHIMGSKLEVVWRLRGGLDKELGVEAPDPADRKRPLPEVLQTVDAVITTPSTVFLESVRLGLPTAILDYHNSPLYLHPAWTITAQRHIPAALDELANPPRSKMQYQRSMFDDTLETVPTAGKRMARLVNQMIEIGQSAKSNGKQLKFPAAILHRTGQSRLRADAQYDRQELFAENKAFQINDVELLQTELSHAIARLESLPRDLRQKNEQLHARVMQANRQIKEMHRLGDVMKLQKRKIYRLQRQIIDYEKLLPVESRITIHSVINSAAASPASQNGPVRTGCAGMKTYDPQRPIIYTHIPKCAGTSFIKLLSNWFGDTYHKLNQDEKVDVRLPRVETRDENGGWLETVKCIQGHFDHGRDYGLPYFYPEIDQYFTILRDPFDIIVSMFFFVKGRSREGRFWYRGEQVNILDDYPTVEHYLRDYPYWLYNHLPQDITLDNYERKLRERFVYIGIQEDLNSSIRQLARIFGKQPAELEVVNESEYDETVPDWMRKQFYDDYPLLHAVYQFARENYNKD